MSRDAEELVDLEVVPEVVARPKRGTGITCAVVGVAVLALLVLGAGDADSVGLKLSDPDDAVSVPVIQMPVLLAAVLFGLLPAVLGGVLAARPAPVWLERLAIAAAVVGGILGFIVWAGSVKDGTTVDITGLLSNTLFLAVPLVLGAMAGVISERSGVINLAIEGQMLGAAFFSAMIATVAGSLVMGLLGGLIAGALVGALLAVFSIRYQVDQVVLGVVLNLFVIGLTTYLYSSVMQRDAEKFNNPPVFQAIELPVLSKIPVLGPLFFAQNLMFYLAIVVVVVTHVMLYHSRWGLRTRAVGEHPRAADTVGVEVNRLRFRNCLIAGAVGGLAGAFLTIGSLGEFGAQMTAGKGYIALAAVIFGRWTPFGATMAAILFSFATSIKTLLSIIGSPVTIPGDFLEMLPYVVTIVLVAGVVGRVRAPAADGVPYEK
ncbi:ABC transporter permease [Nocardioides sp. C4-1]|uniref:ABC transporter permease n=1 Tax=Nocardioides sp. C4-1 TaxID=3151851 RepID=UPI0032650CA8